MSQSLVTEFLGAFRISADSDKEYEARREELLAKIRALGVDILDVTPIQADSIEEVQEEWEQLKKADELFNDDDDDDDEPDFNFRSHLEEAQCYTAEGSDADDLHDEVATVTQQKLFETYPKLLDQMIHAAAEIGVDFNEFSFVECFRDESEFEVIFEHQMDPEFLYFEVMVDPAGETVIKDTIVEEECPEWESKDDDEGNEIVVFSDKASESDRISAIEEDLMFSDDIDQWFDD